MPIFVARWKDMTLSLVEAESESNFLTKVVDIYGDSETQSLSFRELENPLVLTLQLKPKFLEGKHGLEGEECSLFELREDQRKLMEDDIFKDLTVLVDEDQVSCHKAVLARCDYFRKMLASNMSEVSSNKLTLKGTTVAVFRLCLEYLYCREITFTSNETLEELFELLRYGHMIDVPGIVSIAAGSIERALAKECSSCLRLDYTCKQVGKHIRHVEEVQNFPQLLQLRHLDLGCTEIRATWPKSWSTLANSSTFVSASMAQKLEGFLSDDTSEAILRDLKAVIYPLPSDDRGSVSPYFISIIHYLRSEQTPVSLKCLELVRILHEMKFPINKAMDMVVSDTSGCRAKITCTPLLAAASLGSSDMVELLLELGADPFFPVLPTGRTVFHFLENQDGDSGEDRLRATIETLLSKTKYKSVSDIPFADAERFASVDGFYTRHVIDEFLCPLSEQGQAIEFAVCVDNAGDPERVFLDELRRILHPKLQSLWSKHVRENLSNAFFESSGGHQKVERASKSTEDVTRMIVDAIEEDFKRACQYDHPTANNEDAVLTLSLRDLERACLRQAT